MKELSQSVCVTFFKPTYRYSHTKTNTQIIANSTRSMSCTIRSEMNKPINVKRSARRAAKHPPSPHPSPLGRSVYLDFKGVGRSIIQSFVSRITHSTHCTNSELVVSPRLTALSIFIQQRLTGKVSREIGTLV